MGTSTSFYHNKITTLYLTHNNQFFLTVVDVLQRSKVIYHFMIFSFMKC